MAGSLLHDQLVISPVVRSVSNEGSASLACCYSDGANSNQADVKVDVKDIVRKTLLFSVLVLCIVVHR